jgi:radical SAM protein with 4Fe4S-binding SPASM domain
VSRVGNTPFDRLLRDARNLVREEEVDAALQNLNQLKQRCLADPMLLYPRAGFRPRFVVWELTLRCNMRCAHCGSAAGTTRGHELEHEEALRLCDQLGALGCERLTLLGGEPLIRDDWEALTVRLQAAGVRANVITNGWMTADRSLVQRIKDAGLTTFALSIDGYGDQHDQLRRRPGSFRRILQSYDHAGQIGGLRTAAVTTVTHPCVNDLERIYQVLVDQGVGIWQLQVCSPQGRMTRGDPLLPTGSDLMRVADFIVAKKQERQLRIDPSDNIGYFGRWETGNDFRSSQWGRPAFWTGCQAGCQVMGIDANGDIKGCLSLPSEPPFIEGNVRAQPLSEIWHKPGAFAYNRDFALDQLSGFCAECEYRGLCRAGCVSHTFHRAGRLGDNPMCLHRLTASDPPVAEE